MSTATKPTPKGKGKGKAKGKAKPKVERPTEAPVFLNEDGTIKLVENDKGKKVPLRLKTTDFPAGTAGYKGYCDFQIAVWTWKKANKVAASDPMAKRRKKIEAMKKKLAELQKELEADSSDE